MAILTRTRMKDLYDTLSTEDRMHAEALAQEIRDYKAAAWAAEKEAKEHWAAAQKLKGELELWLLDQQPEDPDNDRG